VELRSLAGGVPKSRATWCALDDVLLSEVQETLVAKLNASKRPLSLEIDATPDGRGNELVSLVANDAFLGPVLLDVYEAKGAESLDSDREAAVLLELLKPLGLTAAEAQPLCAGVEATGALVVAARQRIAAVVTDNASTALATARKSADALEKQALDIVSNSVQSADDRELGEALSAAPHVEQVRCLPHAANTVVGKEVYGRCEVVLNVVQLLGQLANSNSRFLADGIRRALTSVVANEFDRTGDRWVQFVRAICAADTHFQKISGFLATADRTSSVVQQLLPHFVSDSAVFAGASADRVLALRFRLRALRRLFEDLVEVVVVCQATFIGAVSPAQLLTFEVIRRRLERWASVLIRK
jgi:hypothetical protein